MREAVLKAALSLLNNRLRRYDYRLLAAPQLQPKRDILPVTLREGEKQTQSGELADGDENWFKFRGRERVRLGQQLAGTVAEGIGIHTTAGTEYTEWGESETFSGSIATFASDKEERVMEAKRHTDESGEFSFSTDGSTLDTWCSRASVLSMPFEENRNSV